MEKVVLKREALEQPQAFVPVRVARVGDLHVYMARYVGELARHRHPHDEFHIVLDGEVELRIEGEGAQTLRRDEGLLVGGGGVPLRGEPDGVRPAAFNPPRPLPVRGRTGGG